MARHPAPRSRTPRRRPPSPATPLDHLAVDGCRLSPTTESSHDRDSLPAPGPTTRFSRSRDEPPRRHPRARIPCARRLRLRHLATPEPSPLSGIVQSRTPSSTGRRSPTSPTFHALQLSRCPERPAARLLRLHAVPGRVPDDDVDVRVALGGLPAAQRRNTQMALITFDPRRDTPAILTRYVHAFFPRGLRCGRPIRSSSPSSRRRSAPPTASRRRRTEGSTWAHGVRLRRRRPGPPPRPVVVRHPAGHLPEGHSPRCSRVAALTALDLLRQRGPPSPARQRHHSLDLVHHPHSTKEPRTMFTSKHRLSSRRACRPPDPERRSARIVRDRGYRRAPKVSGVWARTSTEMMGAVLPDDPGNGNRVQAGRGCRTVVARQDHRAAQDGHGQRRHDVDEARQVDRCPGFRHRQAQARRLPRDADRPQEASGRRRTFPLTLTFATAGKRTVTVTVRKGSRCDAGRSHSWPSRRPPA